MDKTYLIKLTTNLYRLTLLFPKKEPLRYKMRALVDEILADAILTQGENPSKSNGALEVEKKLEVLDSYFEVAKSQNWVSPFDVSEIQEEYGKIKEEMVGLMRLDIPKKKTESHESQKAIELKAPVELVKKERGERQQKILEILKEKGQAQVGELQKIFPEISKRTLRRDLGFLVKQGVAERMGEKNDTFYQLKR